ncbi:hypothetical protein D3C78_1661470 [compost metagenome]
MLLCISFLNGTLQYADTFAFQTFRRRLYTGASFAHQLRRDAVNRLSKVDALPTLIGNVHRGVNGVEFFSH